MSIPRVRVDVAVRGTFDFRRFSASALLVLGSALIANIFSYAFHFILSRKLGPDQYGTLAALMAIAGIFGVMGSSVGTVAMQETARMWSAHLDSHIPHFLRQTGKFVLGLAAIIALVLLALSVLLGGYLHVVNVAVWVLLAIWVGLGLVSGYARGAAQGAHRFWVFAGSMVSEGVLRVVLPVTFVLMGYAVQGALGGLVCAVIVGLLIAVVPMLTGAQPVESRDPEHLRLGGEALKVLAVNVAASALLFIDMLFAKHYFSGVQAGYFGAAGTVAKTIPYGVGLIALIAMPTAAAARHTNRESLKHILRVAGIFAVSAISLALLIIALFSRQLISITYGPHYSGAIPIMHLYAIDEALLAMWIVASSYLVAIAQYRLVWYLFAAVVIEAACMALFGLTPTRLLNIAIVVNALLVPAMWILALRSLREAPQAANPPPAEAFNESPL